MIKLMLTDILSMEADRNYSSPIARMENGIIVEEQDFFDNLDLFTQMGLYQ